jgi:probable HAF family extracellular repeat protein
VSEGCQSNRISALSLVALVGLIFMLCFAAPADAQIKVDPNTLQENRETFAEKLGVDPDDIKNIMIDGVENLASDITGAYQVFGYVTFMNPSLEIASFEGLMIGPLGLLDEDDLKVIRSGQRNGGTTGVSQNPHAVGFLDSGHFTPYHAFRYDIATGDLQDLGTLDPPNNATRSSAARDVSSNGSIVVGLSETSTGGQHAFRWITSGMVDLGSAAGAAGDSRATAVSADGSIVVGQSDFPGSFMLNRAFRWTQAGGFQDLGGQGFAYEITADGSVIVGSVNVGTSTNVNAAFRWTQAGGLSASVRFLVSRIQRHSA